MPIGSMRGERAIVRQHGGTPTVIQPWVPIAEQRQRAAQQSIPTFGFAQEELGDVTAFYKHHINSFEDRIFFAAFAIALTYAVARR